MSLLPPPVFRDANGLWYWRCGLCHAFEGAFPDGGHSHHVADEPPRTAAPVSIPTSKRRIYWFLHCVNCLRLRRPGSFRLCRTCARSWDPLAEDRA